MGTLTLTGGRVVGPPAEAPGEEEVLVDEDEDSTDTDEKEKEEKVDAGEGAVVGGAGAVADSLRVMSMRHMGHFRGPPFCTHQHQTS